MRLPLLPAISSRSAAQNKGAKTANVVSDKNNEIMQKRPALVFSEGYGGLGSGLIDSPNGLMSTWDGAIVDEVGCARIVGDGTLIDVPMTGYDETYITGMSDDGSVCCGWGIRTSDSATRALRMTTDGIEELAYPSGITGKTWAFGISGDGERAPAFRHSGHESVAGFAARRKRAAAEGCGATGLAIASGL